MNQGPSKPGTSDWLGTLWQIVYLPAGQWLPAVAGEIDHKAVHGAARKTQTEGDYGDLLATKRVTGRFLCKRFKGQSKLKGTKLI